MIPNKIVTHIECVEMNWANFIGGGFLLGCATLPQPTALGFAMPSLATSPKIKMRRNPPNNWLQRTALRAAAEPGR